MVAAIAGIFVYSNANRTRAFSERDSVVLADFANSTGEPVFDETLKEALEVQLRQSPFLSVLPEQRLQGMLRMMGRRTDEKITPAIAREVCERTGSKAMIAGAISQLGQSYIISLDAIELPDRRHHREAAGAGGRQRRSAEGPRRPRPGSCGADSASRSHR